MRLAGAIIALIAGIFATFAAGFTLFVGGIGGAFRADRADLVVALGWGGVAFSFLTIIFGAIGIGNKSKIPGFLLILSSLAGAVLGGSLVAVFMALSLIGGILVAIDGGAKAAPKTSSAATTRAARTCAKCKSSIAAGQLFCGTCGTAVAPLDTQLGLDNSRLPDPTDLVSPVPTHPAHHPEQRQKVSNLAWLGIASVGVVIGLAAFFVFSTYMDGRSEKPNETNIADVSPASTSMASTAEPAIAPPTQNIANETPLEPEATPSSQLAQLLSPDLLGTTVAHFEQQIGPAYRILDTDRIYLLDECRIRIGSENDTIRNVGIDNYGGSCVFAVAPFFGSWLSDLRPTFAFGDVVSGTYSASCLRGCGNAADPEAYVFYSGSRADNFVELFASASSTEDDVSQATTIWSDALEGRFNEDYVLSGTYKCQENLNEVAEAAFSKVRPTSVRVGYDLDPQAGCSRSQ
jgi:hypothetical protein